MHVMNLILSTSVSPVSWKQSLVTLISKVTPPRDYSDLRLISILSRIYEKLFLKKFFLEAIPNNIVDDQFAFRPTGSTNALEYGNHIRYFLTDFSKAFDTVPNHQLLGKVVSYNCPQIFINCIANYLTDRSQSVTRSSGCSLPLRFTTV
jgi:Reverse transcriptase (RNA-dependent DNA polymerase)